MKKQIEKNTENLKQANKKIFRVKTLIENNEVLDLRVKTLNSTIKENDEYER